MPQLLAQGRLGANVGEPWPNLIATSMTGTPWAEQALTGPQQLALVADQGPQIGRLRPLLPSGMDSSDDWPIRNATEALRQSSSPLAPVSQVERFLASLGPCEPMLVHGDLSGRHVFVEACRPPGIIAWGDAILTDRHHELAKLHLDSLDADRTLLAAFLDASNRPIRDGLAPRAPGMSLCRQARGPAQHRSTDVFQKLPERLRGQEVDTLDSPARELRAS